MRITNEELIQIIKEELEAVIDEKKGKKRKAAKKKRRKKKKAKKAKKKDACYRKVKARYKVWPSAYASGALVTCRKKGAKNWGNKSEGLNEEFEKHDMYDPETGEKHRANVEGDHTDMAGKGFVHVDPKKIEKILRDEGGAAGMDPFLKEFGKDMEEEILKALENMPSVAQHEDGDYILDDNKEVDLQEKKNCGCGQTPCKTYGRQEELAEKTDGKGAKDYEKGKELQRWFNKGGWVQTGGKYDGKPCAKQPGQKTKPYCRDPDDRAKMSKKERDKRAAKKRKKDPNPNRKGKAKNVSQKDGRKKK